MASEQPSKPFNPDTNPFKAQRRWPPDFDKMDQKNQFRLERRYRRRAKLAYARPGWMRAIKLTQYLSISACVGYGIFIMDWGEKGNPFQGVRDWTSQKANSIWTVTSTQPTRPNIDRIPTKPHTRDG